MKHLDAFRPYATALGISLDEFQPHVAGERFLMGTKKLVLLGYRGNMRIVVKASCDARGAEELRREHVCRETLKKIDFAYRVFRIPDELWHGATGEWLVTITEYIDQPTPFLARPLHEQFALALRALKLQEGVHAATYAHAKVIRDTFGFWGAATYLRRFSAWNDSVRHAFPSIEGADALERARRDIENGREDIERYCGFLTHEDFALQNVRFAENDIYLIDLVSLRFGNKFESWARFLNFMLLYNRPLEQGFFTYVKSNRSEEERISLRLMRLFKLGELLAYHARAYTRADGNLRALSEARIKFWVRVLSSLLDDTYLADEAVQEYKRARDTLRSDTEKSRQKELQQL